MHTAEHALKPTVLLGAEELAILATRTAAPDARPPWRAAAAAAPPSAIARLLRVAAAVTRAALRVARGRVRARR